MRHQSINRRRHGGLSELRCVAACPVGSRPITETVPRLRKRCR